MRPEQALNKPAFMSYALQLVYQLVEGITRKKIYILEGHTSTQRLRMI